MSNLTSYYFWFTQPSTTLSPADKTLIYIFFGMLAVSIVFLFASKFTKHLIYRKLFKKFWHLIFWIAIGGVVWSALRYENTPIFAERYWAGLNFVIGIVWLIFILKYLVFNFRGEKSEYDHELIRSKYLPKSNR
jgi:hypothetical protein